MSSALLIGIGNELRGDDAAGLLVARQVREEQPAESVLVLEHEGDPGRLIAAWEQAGAVVLVDATTCGVPAGTVHRLELSSQQLPEVNATGLTHGLGLIHAMALARALGRAPQQMIVYGIEGADFGFGQPVSRAVLQAVAVVAEHVAQDLQRLCSPSSR